MHDKLKIDEPADLGEPAWEIATLFPNQGQWSAEEYLALETNHLVEFTQGHIEVPPMPTEVHQLIVLFLVDALRDFVARRKLGIVLLAPLIIRLNSEKYREPDVVFMLADHANRRHNEFWERADLVMEVVSEHNRDRDLQRKRRDYAMAKIPEYWIVDPQLQEITVLVLDGEGYKVHGVFKARQRATSVLLKRFGVSVSAVFKAGRAAGRHRRRG